MIQVKFLNFYVLKTSEVNEEAFRRQIENPRSRRNEALDALAQSLVEDFIF